MTGPLPWGPPSAAGISRIDGGITAVEGIRAAGIIAGLKDSGAPDLALVDAGVPVAVAVTTTTNLVKAAPCIVTERYAASGRARAVVVNAGNANACTGQRGLDDAVATSTAVAGELGCEPGQVLPLSTGIIGVPMPMDRLLPAVPTLVADLGGDEAAGDRAAHAIMTTDTASKTIAVEVADDNGSCVVGGFAKGAGMMEPAMATMIAVIATDAQVPATILGEVLRQAVARSFNRISIDACGSTNDTVVLLATGSSRPPPGLDRLRTGIELVCAQLAQAIVADGEGTSKVAAVTVEGAANDEDAERLARAVTSSTLFRAAVHGADPNWGRIMAALGSAGVVFDPAAVRVACGDITVCRGGVAAPFERGRATAALSGDEVSFEIGVGSGPGRATMLTADLTPAYVTENAYSTT